MPEIQETVTANFSIESFSWDNNQGTYRLTALGKHFTLYVVVSTETIRVYTSHLPANILAMKSFYEPAMQIAGNQKLQQRLGEK